MKDSIEFIEFAKDLTNVLQKHHVYFSVSKEGIDIRKCNDIQIFIVESTTASGHPYPLLRQAIN